MKPKLVIAAAIITAIRLTREPDISRPSPRLTAEISDSVTHDSAQYCYVDGQLQWSKMPQQFRSLNQNHSHVIKEIFKSGALSTTVRPEPFQDYYAGLLARGKKPEMARFTLVRKIAAITLTLWRKALRISS